MKGPDDKTSKPPRPPDPAKVPEIGKAAREGVAQVLAQAAEILLPPGDSPKATAPAKVSQPSKPPTSNPSKPPTPAKPSGPSSPPKKVQPQPGSPSKPTGKLQPPPADFLQSPEEPAQRKPVATPPDFMQPPDEAPKKPKRPSVPEPAPFLQPPEPALPQTAGGGSLVATPDPAGALGNAAASATTAMATAASQPAPAASEAALPAAAQTVAAAEGSKAVVEPAPPEAALLPAPSQAAGGGLLVAAPDPVGAPGTATATAADRSIAAAASQPNPPTSRSSPPPGEMPAATPEGTKGEAKPVPGPGPVAAQPVHEAPVEPKPSAEVPLAPQVSSQAPTISPSCSAGGGRGEVGAGRGKSGGVREESGGSRDEAGGIAKLYSLREVSQLLAAAAAVMFLLDADGLLTWVKRMEVGPAQSAWLAVVAPYQKAFETAKLTSPRRAAGSAADAIADALGGTEDTLFAEAWSLVEMAPYLDAMAEQSPALGPLAPVPAKATAPTATGQDATVLLVGDSLFAGNLAAAIGKTFGKGSGVKVVSAYQTATGLSRPDIFDWGWVVAPLIERERPRWVVCSFGANDAQAIRVDDKLLPFGEPAWEAVYRQRVRTMMKQVAAGGAKVLWLGLPPMRDEAFDRRVKHLNSIFAREARAVPGVDFLELSMLFSGPDGGYATFVSDGKRLVRVRMEDGVHYAPAGAQSIARWVWDWTRERR